MKVTLTVSHPLLGDVEISQDWHLYSVDPKEELKTVESYIDLVVSQAKNALKVPID